MLKIYLAAFRHRGDPLDPPLPLTALRKQIVGAGPPLPGANPPPPGTIPVGHPFPIGTTIPSPPFPADTAAAHALTVAEISLLSILYNESFGIVHGDSAHMKRQKFIHWACGG